MPVVNDGHQDVNGSYADSVFESMWRGVEPPSREHVTLGPLASWDGSDPVETEKLARVVGERNNFESTSGPGMDRVVQSPDPASDKQDIDPQTPNSSRGGPVASGQKDSSPSKGAKGGSVADKVKNKLKGMSNEGPDEGQRSDNEKTLHKGPDHNLLVKEPPPVAKELDPHRRVGNLADGHDKAVWTGSGPRAALHDDYSKVGGVLPLLEDDDGPARDDDPPSDDAVWQRLLEAGVPPRPLPETSLLWKVASERMVKEAADTEYFARDDVHPLKLVAMLDDLFGAEWREWEPESVHESLSKEAGVDVGDAVMNKIMAVKIALRRPDVFYDNWQAMEKMAVAFNDHSPVHGTTEDVPVEWLSNAVAVMSKISAPGDFSPEVETYVASRLFDSGYVVSPPLLRFADNRLGEMVRDDKLRSKVVEAYVKQLSSEKPVAGEDRVSVQVARLMSNHAYVIDRGEEMETQLS